MKKKWVEGYLAWKSKLSETEYEKYCKDKTYNCDVPVKGSLPPCECGEEEEKYRPLTEEEDVSVSWVWRLIQRFEND